jgi:hypothetical protein
VLFLYISYESPPKCFGGNGYPKRTDEDDNDKKPVWRSRAVGAPAQGGCAPVIEESGHLLNYGNLLIKFKRNIRIAVHIL